MPACIMALLASLWCQGSVHQSRTLTWRNLHGLPSLQNSQRILLWISICFSCIFSMFTKICVFQNHISVSNPFYFNGKAPSSLVEISMAFQCNSEGTTFLSAELLTCPHSTPVCKLLEPGASLLQHFFHLSPFLASSSSSSSSSLSSSSSSSSFLQYSPSIEPKVY